MDDEQERTEVYKALELSNNFHDHYRTIGIALSVSLATAAGTMIWWLYSPIYFVKSGSPVTCCQLILWFVTMLSGLVVFVCSFVIQFLNFKGSMYRARSHQSTLEAYFADIEQRDAPDGPIRIKAVAKRIDLQDKAKIYTNRSTVHYTNADIVVTCVAWASTSFLVAFLAYMLLCAPMKTS